MIRFIPDNLREALLRPLAMAAPDGGVYVEIMAPDLRPMFLLLLVVLTVILYAMRKINLDKTKPVWLLTLATCAAFPIWLYTTGNGRYFLPFLLISGLLCVGAVHALPLTKTYRLLIAGLMLATQSIVVFQAGPFDSWALARWTNAPYFGLEMPKIEKPGNTIVTISGITYSLVALQFPKETRWMSLTSAPPAAEKSKYSELTQQLLDNPNGVYLLAPAILKLATPGHLPGIAILDSINITLSEYGLKLSDESACQFLASASLNSYANRHVGALPDRKEGFWYCLLQRSNAVVSAEPLPPKKYDQVFQKLEAECPRFFTPNGARTKSIEGGEVRQYGNSDMKVYVLDNGSVLYKYFRALNPVYLGVRVDLLSGAVNVDCSKITGRSGLPWERGL